MPFKNCIKERKSMKNKKIKFLSGVSSLIVAFSAISTGFVSATEPNPSMPNLSESDSVSIMADYIRNASEKEVFDAIESGRAIKLTSNNFSYSIGKNYGISMDKKFKLFSYYAFIRLLKTNGETLSADEKINWDTYDKPGYEFCLRIKDIVEKNKFYGEDENYENNEIKSFHCLCSAIALMTLEEEHYSEYERIIISKYRMSNKVADAFEMLEIAFKYL